MATALVRAATADDAGLIAKVQLEFWQQAYAEILPTSLLLRTAADQVPAWEARLVAGGAALLAVEGDEAVGFALLAAEPADDGTGDLEAMGVLPRWSRRGHGGRLLATAGLLLRAAGASSGRYWVPDADGITPAFLRAAGWSQLGSRRVLDTGDGLLTEIAYGGTLDLVLM